MKHPPPYGDHLRHSLLALLLVFILGAHLIFDAGFLAARLHWKAVAAISVPEDFTRFSAPANLIKWNGDDEFWYKGKLYDAVSIQIEKDTVRCYVFEDRDETVAYATLTNIMSGKSDYKTLPHLFQDRTELRPMVLFYQDFPKYHHSGQQTCLSPIFSHTNCPPNEFVRSIDRPPMA